MKHFNPTTIIPCKTLIAALLMIFCFACDKSDSDNPEPEPKPKPDPKPQITVATFDKTEYFPYDPVMIHLQEKPVKAQYDATLGDTPVTVIRMDDSTLVAITPDISAGEYLLNIPIGEKQYQGRLKIIPLPTVENPEVVISEIQSFFLNAVAEVQNNNNPNADLIESLENSFNAEFEKLTVTERQLLATFWVAHPELNFEPDIQLRNEEVHSFEYNNYRFVYDFEKYTYKLNRLRRVITLFSVYLIISTDIELFPMHPVLRTIALTFTTVAGVNLLMEAQETLGLYKKICWDNYVVAQWETFKSKLTIKSPFDSFTESAILRSSEVVLKNDAKYDYTLKQNELLVCELSADMRTVYAKDITSPTTPDDVRSFISLSNTFMMYWAQLGDYITKVAANLFLSGAPQGISDIKEPYGVETVNFEKYSLVITSGNVEAKKTDANTYRFTTTATESVPFTFRFKVYEHESEEYTALLEVETAPKITTETILPDGKKGEPYSFTFTATGTEPITWYPYDGGVAVGFTFYGETGVLSGTPAESGTFNFTLRAHNEFGEDTKDFTLMIKEGDDEEGNPDDDMPAFLVGTWWSKSMDNQFTREYNAQDFCGNRTLIQSQAQMREYTSNNQGVLIFTADGQVNYKRCGVNYIGAYRWKYNEHYESNPGMLFLPTTDFGGFLQYSSKDEIYMLDVLFGDFRKVSGDMTKPFVSVSPSELHFTAVGGQASINITSNTHWLFPHYLNSHYYGLSPTSGTNNGTVTLNVGVNGSSSQKITTLTCTGIRGMAVENDQTITIIQDGATLSVSLDTLRFDASGGRKSFNINSNTKWVTSDNLNFLFPWVTVSPESGSNNSTVTVTVDPYTGTETYTPSDIRTANFTVQGGEIRHKIIVIQDPPVPSLNVEPTTLYFPSSGGQATFSVTSNRNPWQISGNTYWAKVSTTIGKRDDVVTVTALENNGISQRTTTLIIDAWDVPAQQVNIIQQAPTLTMTVTPTSLNFTASVEEKTFTITSNTNWTVRCDSSWVTVSPSYGYANGTVTVATTANTSISRRTSTITVSGAGLSPLQINLTQEGAIQTSTLTVSPTSLNFAASGEQKSFSVTSNTNWTVSSNATWATVSPASGDNNGTVNITAAANTSTASRTATVTVTGTGLSPQNINITQEAQAPALTVSPTSLIFSVSGEQKSLNVTSNTNWNVSSDASWVTVSPASGNNNGIVNVTAAANTGSNQRTATVTVNGSGVSPRQISITQEAATTLTVTPSSLSFQASGEQKTLSVTSDTDWSVSCSASWITISPTSGSKNGTVRVTASANTAEYERMATIIVSASGLPSQVISVEQAAIIGTNPFVETWTKDNSGGAVTLIFTATTWTSYAGDSPYNSGTYTFTGNTAVLTVTNKGSGSASVGSTGNATISNGKLSISGFSDANMNGSYSKYVAPDLETSAFNGRITATVQNGHLLTETKTVKAMLYHEGEGFVIASGSYANGGFTITLPSSPNVQYLNTIGSLFGGASSMNISDKNARIMSIDLFEAFDKDDNLVGGFMYASALVGKTITYTQFIYTDRDVIFTGSYNVREGNGTMYYNYSVSLKRGWNILYMTGTENGNNSNWIVTTKAVGGLRWTYE